MLKVRLYFFLGGGGDNRSVYKISKTCNFLILGRIFIFIFDQTFTDFLILFIL